MSDSVVDLVDACLDGDQHAAAGIVRLFKGRVFGLCLRMVGHQQDAEDVAQETFVRALRSLRNWDRSQPFEPWLMAIAANRCRTLVARRSRWPVATDAMDRLPEPSRDVASARQLAEEVRTALTNMRDEYREAFCLFHEQHRSYEEIAEACDRPLGTIKTWIHRARREIVEHLMERGLVEQVSSEVGKRDAVRPTSTAH